MIAVRDEMGFCCAAANPAPATAITAISDANAFLLIFESYLIAASLSWRRPWLIDPGNDYEHCRVHARRQDEPGARGAAGRLFAEQEANPRCMMFQAPASAAQRHRRSTRSASAIAAGRFETYKGAWLHTQTNYGTSVSYQLSIDVAAFLLKRLLERDAAVMIDLLKAEINGRADRRQ